MNTDAELLVGLSIGEPECSGRHCFGSNFSDAELMQ